MTPLKKLIPAVFSLAILSSNAIAFAETPVPVNTEAPAPIEADAPKKPAVFDLSQPLVKFENIRQLNTTIGYRPLNVPRIYGYSPISLYVVGGNLVQLSYESNIDMANLIVRTAVITDIGTENISGYNNLSFTECPINRTMTKLARRENGAFVLEWSIGRYAFSIEASNILEEDFFRQVKGLVKLSEQRYGRTKK